MGNKKNKKKKIEIIFSTVLFFADLEMFADSNSEGSQLTNQILYSNF